MELNKCIRCGCFFTSDTDTCCHCATKDYADIAKLRAYFDDNSAILTAQELSLNTGITIGNLNRYLQDEEFSNYIKPTAGKNKEAGNIGVF